MTRPRWLPPALLLLLLLILLGPLLAAPPEAPSEVPPDAPLPPRAPAAQAPAGQARWRTLADLPVGVFSAAGAAVGEGRIVVTGGLNQLGMASDTVQVYDLAADQWTLPVRLDLGRYDHVQATLPDGRVLVMGGKTGSFRENRPPRADGVLIDLQQGSVHAVAPLREGLHQATAHVLPDGRVMVVGGSAASLFDPQREAWVGHIPLRESRQAHASVLLPDGRVLVAGGTHRDTLELIDAQRKVSQRLAIRLPGPADDLRAALLADGRVWITGGQDSRTGATLAATWLVDLSGPRSRITAGPDLPVEGGLADHGLVRLGEVLVTVGGETEQDGKDTERTTALRLDPLGPRIEPLPDTAAAHDDAVTVAVGDRVIVIGGLAYQMVAGANIPRALRTVEQLAPGTPNEPEKR